MSGRKFTVVVDCDNSAFDGDDAMAELARILRSLGDSLESYSLTKDQRFPLRDANGNRVGYALLSEED